MTDKPKRISDSQFAMSALMNPQDANPMGNVHGGVIMKLVDEAAAIVAMRHAEAPAVTVAIDSMTFLEPIVVGSLVQCEAELTYVGKTSMEVRVQVIVENPFNPNDRRVTNTAYAVYVALDANGRPMLVPRLLLETPDQEKRAALAVERQNFRKQQRAQEQQLR